MDDRVFTVQSRIRVIAISIAFRGLCALTLIGGVLTIFAEGVHVGILFGIVVGVLSLAGGITSLNAVCMIEVGNDGTIALRRVVGASRFLFFGSCGVLDKDILSGHIAVPTAAYRDEGTSYHYLAPSAYVDLPTAERLAGILQDLDVPYHLTRTWTTDAIYRETRANMAKCRAEGCRVVDMECASTAAVAR